MLKFEFHFTQKERAKLEPTNNLMCLFVFQMI